MFFLERVACWQMGHDWHWLTKRTQECRFCGATRVVE